MTSKTHAALHAARRAVGHAAGCRVSEIGLDTLDLYSKWLFPDLLKVPPLIQIIAICKRWIECLRCAPAVFGGEYGEIIHGIPQNGTCWQPLTCSWVGFGVLLPDYLTSCIYCISDTKLPMQASSYE
jgi:hypothetical protein